VKTAYFMKMTIDYRHPLYKGTGKAIPVQYWTGKAIPVQYWTGPVVARRLKLPDFETFDT
jgi:hypothetical protein